VRPPVRPSQTENFFAPERTVDLLRRADNWILTGAAVFRRDLVMAAGGFNIAVGSFADGFLTRRLALQHGFVYVPVVGLNWRISPTGLSRSAASGAETARRTIGLMLAHVAADPVFPQWYAPLLERRWRFSVGRIAVETNPIHIGPLVEYCARSAFDRWMYRLAANLWYPAGSTLALVWLTLRERPTSLAGLLATAIVRRVEALRDKTPSA
jgi:hypothetical protein